MYGPPVARPGVGRAGKKIRVRVNHFLVKCTATGAVHYDVDIEPIRRPPPEGATPFPPRDRPTKAPPRETLRSPFTCTSLLLI